ncbi:MAG: hypothetical protein RLW62_04150, partial [Gammaproteobacteria bacterium]
FDGTGVDLSLSRVREMLDGALARAQAHQLHNAAGQATPGTPLVVELPVRHQERVDLWRFEFHDDERTGADTAPAASRARVSIRLLLGDAVVFGAELRIAGDTVGIRMGANDARLNTALARDAARLDARLHDHGLAVAALVIDADAPPPGVPRLPRRLVDERA